MRAAGSCRTRQSRRSARGTTTVTWRRCRRGTAATTRRSQSYATQGSNPRRAGRVPGRSAAHTVGPRLGQASLDWPALKTSLVLAPRPAAAPLCDANGRQCVQVLAVLWLYLPWSLPPWTSPCRCSTYYGYTSYGCAVCVQVVAYDTENSDMYPPGQGAAGMPMPVCQTGLEPRTSRPQIGLPLKRLSLALASSTCTLCTRPRHWRPTPR